MMFCSSIADAEECNDGIAEFIGGHYANAIAIFRPLAEQENACAEFQLGMMYLQGVGVTQDKARALELFKQAAKNGSNEAKIQASLLE